MRYVFIENNKNKWTVKSICKVLGVSESGYYRYIKNKDKPGKDKVLSVAIKEILDENPLNDNYGVPRIQLALVQRGIKAGNRRITVTAQ